MSIKSYKASLAVILAIGLIAGRQVSAVDPTGGIGNLLGGVTHAVGDLTGGALTTGAGGLGALGLGGGGRGVGRDNNGLFGVIPNVLNSANSMVNGVTRPMMGLLGSLTGGVAGPLGPNGLAGGLLGDTLRLTSGALNGLAGGAPNGIGLPGAAHPAGPLGANPNMMMGLHNPLKREAAAKGVQNMLGGSPLPVGPPHMAPGLGALPGQLAHRFPMAGARPGSSLLGPGSLGPAGALMHESNMPAVMGPENFGPANNLGPLSGAIAPLAGPLAQLPASRLGLANDALRNAQLDAASAGGDMAVHAANNARSAALASNAYRQAKLANARDRVNVAGTIQNSARISDAAIATHDAATKAEDSLTGSELAVDSASTVLDSDGAYIPPVTSSLLRSLPYGRIGVRNIVPKPLTYPSILLPDVWLSGAPVNYLNIPMRALPYTIGTTAATNPVWASASNLANGRLLHPQPFLSNHGVPLSNMIIDPAFPHGPLGTGHMLPGSMVPVLANGHLEAQDELANMHSITMQQLGGAGMAGTYNGYSRLNSAPMLTGSVNSANIIPTSNVATTYPIGSALVIEPRDAFFQDYIDNASSRQNFDERQQ